jgi:hypothetical protein
MVRRSPTGTEIRTNVDPKYSALGRDALCRYQLRPRRPVGAGPGCLSGSSSATGYLFSTPVSDVELASES